MIAILIVCIVILFYIHLREQFKTSNDLELYEIINPSRIELHELCDIKQPILFNNNEIFSLLGMSCDKLCNEYGKHEINIRELDNNNANNNNANIKNNELMFLSDSLKLFDNDTDCSNNKIFISENNNQFLIDTRLNISLRKFDDVLRPNWTVKYKYDFTIGSMNFTSLLKSNIHCQYYIMVMEGEIELKLFTPINYKYLYDGMDINENNFTSKINVWDVQDDMSDRLGKTVSMTVNVKKGQIFFVPSQWWYSYKCKVKTILYTAKYITLMNLISNAKFVILQTFNK